MDYYAPETTDLANVSSLNSAFIGLLRDSASGKSLRQQLPRDLHPVVAGLSDLEVERLASTPFLLMSFREHDLAFWRLLDNESHIHDLFLIERATDELERLIMASLGFLWQLAQRNPFAARLVTGAPIEWCERIAGATLMKLLHAAARRQDMLELRFAGQRHVWDKLLGPGVNRDADARTAAQMTALQVLLTAEAATPYHQPRAAACARSTPNRRRDAERHRD
jgi:hypothetical protein